MRRRADEYLSPGGRRPVASPGVLMRMHRGSLPTGIAREIEGRVKALTLWQPWATLVAMEQKRIETRCWTTKYRGELAIHSAAKLPAKYLGASSRTEPFRDELADLFCVRRDRDDRGGKHVDDVLRRLPCGKIVCIVRLVEIEEIGEMLRETLTARERLFGNFEDGRYAWHLQMVDVIEPPIPAKGNRMLWNWSLA